MTHDHSTAIISAPYRRLANLLSEDESMIRQMTAKATHGEHPADHSATRFTKSPEINMRQSQEKKNFRSLF
jgi:hypothetical protein